MKAFPERAALEGVTVEQYYASHTADIPSGRFGEPAEIGDIVSFLADDKSNYINGVNIIISGGKITH